jgi:hypothetical protein
MNTVSTEQWKHQLRNKNDSSILTAGMRVGSWQACRQTIFHSQSKSTQKQAKTEGRSKQITSSKLTTGTLKALVIEIIETAMQYPANSNNFFFQLQHRTSLATIKKRK